MSVEPADALDTRIRRRCEGITPLTARLEPWQRDVCADARLLDDALRLHGSPINVIGPLPMAANASELADAAISADLDLTIYFARKANKSLALVDQARRLGLGVDVASERELAQVLERSVPPDAVIVTAAVKSTPLLELCLASGVSVVLDNLDEMALLRRLAARTGARARVALRLRPDLGVDRTASRFGFTAPEAIVAAATGAWPEELLLTGVHFHLDGYAAEDRVRGIEQALSLVDALRSAGRTPSFLDIGGGIPMSYLEDGHQWQSFWAALRASLRGEHEPLTFENHGLGLLAHKGEILGAPKVYPYHQPLTRGAWLAAVLGATTSSGASVAAEIRRRDLELRCEPGRALLDGCGLTAARVAFRKPRGDGTWLVGVEMNRTQCRSTSEDFLVDPLLVGEPPDGTRAAPIEGYLVGSYCIERELLTWRRLRFPAGVGVGDIVVFPNTAGYLMHILESSSHQIPLARNLVVTSLGDLELDPIDA